MGRYTGGTVSKLKIGENPLLVTPFSIARRIFSPLFAALDFLHDFPPDQPVCNHHVTVDGAHHIGPRLFQDGDHPVKQFALSGLYQFIFIGANAHDDLAEAHEIAELGHSGLTLSFPHAFSSPGIDLFRLSIIIITEVKSSMDIFGLTEKKQEGGAS